MFTGPVPAEWCKHTVVGLPFNASKHAPHLQLHRWTAVYKVIPDEQPVIEQTLKDMVTCLVALRLLIPSNNYCSASVAAAV